MPEKKIHSSGTRKDAEAQRSKNYSDKLNKIAPVHKPSESNSTFRKTARVVAASSAIPAKSSINKADKQGRYKK